MSTKKILLIVGGIFTVLLILVGLFVGSIMWVAFSTIGKSEAAQTAKAFLQQNEKLKSDIGEVREFGFWVTGNINSSNSNGEATLNLKVVGAKKTVPASVNLTYRGGREWRVVEASYRNDAGQTVDLFDAYGTDETEAEDVGGDSAPDDSVDADSGETVAGFNEESFSTNVLQAEGTTLVVFSTKYSLDSQALDKTLDELSEDYAERVNLVRYSVEDAPVVLQRFKLKLMPVIMVYKDGRQRERHEGAISKPQLAALLDKYLETE
ncbi:MAG TPA: cytochrome c oxidase assembly factor Coa1 family protein [Pyrinomonadaceae bacterium]|jgi:thioredoxin 1|nr:cytochrome c oxidase assembly factor Coa1 family protein [Pyrinomonadaceae bacterium]